MQRNTTRIQLHRFLTVGRCEILDEHESISLPVPGLNDGVWSNETTVDRNCIRADDRRVWEIENRMQCDECVGVVCCEINVIASNHKNDSDA